MRPMNAAAAHHKPDPATVVEVARVADLTTIFDPAVQVCWFARTPDSALTEYLAQAAAAGRLRGSERRVVTTDRAPEFAGLPALPGAADLQRDAAWLAEIYAALLGCPALGLRLEVLERAMCPRFHVDRVGIRMLCTYRGPGTEWLDERCADRRWLGQAGHGKGDAESGLILDPAGIGRAPPFAVVLLKGALWQGNTGRGAIHRSPAVAAGEAPRVVLALDAIWQD
ncbi:MAG: DUF1826 domain-containing protein [Thiotrichales bacterium]